jgi:hypothetical protein
MSSVRNVAVFDFHFDSQNTIADKCLKCAFVIDRKKTYKVIMRRVSLEVIHKKYFIF